MEHLIALEFDHKVGNSITSSFPVLSDNPIHHKWEEYLPFIAIPDKAHSSGDIVIQFSLPSNNEKYKKHSFGLAIFKSMSASDDEKMKYHRGYVQKSLCIIMSKPWFGIYEKELKNMISNNFKDLNSSIETMFNELKQKEDKMLDFSGIYYSYVVYFLNANLLCAIKALLLGRNVLVFGDNSEVVSKLTFALGTLVPGYLTDDSNVNLLNKNNSFFFAPYSPLQYTDLLKEESSLGKLIGACNNMFLLDSPVVKYDVLIDCREGSSGIYYMNKTNDIYKVTDIERKWFNQKIDKIRVDLNAQSACKQLYDLISVWYSSMYKSILSLRHLKDVPDFMWMYLDWKIPFDTFGELFIRNNIKLEHVINLIKNGNPDDFKNTDDEILVGEKPNTLQKFIYKLQN